MTDAATQLLGTPPAADAVAAELGTAYGDVTVGLGTITDELQFAQRFERLPDAEAKLVGRTLGAIQAQLTPEGAGGVAHGRRAQRRHPVRPGDVPGDGAGRRSPMPRRATRRSPCCRSRSRTSRASTRSPTRSRPATWPRWRQRVDPALSDAGAAELISSIAFLMGQKIPAEGELGTTFNTAYQAALP